MKNKFKITAIVALLIFAASTVTNGQYRRANSRMAGPGQCMDIPGLTDAQKEKITSINEAHQKTIDTMREEFFAEKNVMAANDIKVKMTQEQNNHLKKISEVLNDEQLKYFNENIITVPARNTATYGRGGRGPCGMGYGNNNGPGRGRGMGYGNMNRRR